jgi:hypothetical protein
LRSPCPVPHTGLPVQGSKDDVEGPLVWQRAHRGHGFGGSCADPGEVYAGIRITFPIRFSVRNTRSVAGRLSPYLVSGTNRKHAAPGAAGQVLSAQWTSRLTISATVFSL